MDDEDQLAVMAKLEPYLERIYGRFDAAFDLYLQEYSDRARAELDERASASALWCHILKEFQREFLEEPGFHFIERRGLHLINMRDELVMRWKKVDENGRHRNADTEQQRQFDAQATFPDIPAAAARLVLGYQPDLAWSRIERVTVRRPKGRWVSQIAMVGETYQWTDITPAELPFTKERGRRSTGA